MQKERVALAESALELSTIEIEREVSRAWASVYTTKRTFQVYRKMDSIFEDIERAARIRYETEATSKLEYLATSNQANEVKIQLEQSYRDYLKSIQRLNLWFVSDTIYDVPDLPVETLDEPLNFLVVLLYQYRLLQLMLFYNFSFYLIFFSQTIQLLTILPKLLNFGFQFINFFKLLLEAIIFIKSLLRLLVSIILTFFEDWRLNSLATCSTEVPLLYPQFNIFEIFNLLIFSKTR